MSGGRVVLVDQEVKTERRREKGRRQCNMDERDSKMKVEMEM